MFAKLPPVLVMSAGKPRLRTVGICSGNLKQSRADLSGQWHSSRINTACIVQVCSVTRAAPGHLEEPILKVRVKCRTGVGKPTRTPGCHSYSKPSVAGPSPDRENPQHRLLRSCTHNMWHGHVLHPSLILQRFGEKKLLGCLLRVP
ncbi:hypothetical protein Y1Q_0014674 [Alligator mississippiensis]|uniref:Uncharacterized protein n=1 Tax=Alligator mississippiensis TaxID=8496 RepID=A0A151P8B5_ALLMI|nr:hypothetical protein Y1Q_0014674 [Alligator mississippiensis]